MIEPGFIGFDGELAPEEPPAVPEPGVDGTAACCCPGISVAIMSATAGPAALLGAMSCVLDVNVASVSLVNEPSVPVTINSVTCGDNVVVSLS